MIDIGTLGGTCGFPSWINSHGQVVGYSDLVEDQVNHPFLWTNAKGMQDLGTLGGSYGTASMINDFGEVVGGSSLEGNSQFDAFLWDGKMRDLGALDGCAYPFWAVKPLRSGSGYKACLFVEATAKSNLSWI